MGTREGISRKDPTHAKPFSQQKKISLDEKTTQKDTNSGEKGGLGKIPSRKDQQIGGKRFPKRGRRATGDKGGKIFLQPKPKNNVGANVGKGPYDGRKRKKKKVQKQSRNEKILKK